MNNIEKLYEIAKEFAESKAKIKMPAFEKFKYDDYTHTKEHYDYNEYTNEMVIACYYKVGYEWLTYEDNKKYISLYIDYDYDKSYIKIIKKYDDYYIEHFKKIE